LIRVGDAEKLGMARERRLCHAPAWKPSVFEPEPVKLCAAIKAPKYRRVPWRFVRNPRDSFDFRSRWASRCDVWTLQRGIPA
jgi:hypothetical protein